MGKKSKQKGRIRSNNLHIYQTVSFVKSSASFNEYKTIAADMAGQHPTAY
jgi:hypothetical protein